MQEKRCRRLPDAAEVEPQAIDGGMERSGALGGEEERAWLFIFGRKKLLCELVGVVVFGTDDNSILLSLAVNEKRRRLGRRKCVFADIRKLFPQEVNGMVNGWIALKGKHEVEFGGARRG